MEKERILSYTMSQQLTEEDLQHISAAGVTAIGTGHGGSGPGGMQGSVDVISD